MSSPLDNVDVHDAGEQIILSCEDEAALKQAMEALEKEGAQRVQDPVRVGKKWIASFENPAIQQCVVERFGFRIVVSGESEQAVVIRSFWFRERGALIEKGPLLEDGRWKIYLDDVGARTGGMVGV